MLETELKLNFNFKTLASNKKKAFKGVEEKDIENVVSQLKHNITSEKHFDEPISDMTRSVRLTRGITSAKPLIETGRMLKSIEAKGTKISVKKYGVMQNDGYLVNDGKEHAFYSPRGRKAKKLYMIKANTVVPPRPWLIYRPSIKSLDLFMKNVMKFLRTPMRTVKTVKVDI